MGGPHLHTIHKDQMVRLEESDWILPEPDGQHYYACKSDIFEATYEAVDVVPPNDPSSATRPTRACDCNRDAMAGFAAAHG